MTAADSLKAALGKVDWNENVKGMVADDAMVARLARCAYRIAVWSKQLETADKGNPALAFVRDMQISGQHVAALAALALYRPAAYCIRCVLESALYYTYFRLHPGELATLARDPRYYVEKEVVLNFHKTHTRRFAEREEKLGLLSRLDEWYKKLSALAHGQVPGAWVAHVGLAQVKHDKETLEAVVAAFQATEGVVHALLLCTAAQDLWAGFTMSAKQELLKGLPGDAKATLALTAM